VRLAINQIGDSELKILLVLLVLALLVCGFFYYQGLVSAAKTAAPLVNGGLAVCGSKPNCVSSAQNPTDDHYIEPIALGSRNAEDIVLAVESLGGVVISNDGKILHATFTSGIFRFIDDVQMLIDDGKLAVRSSSRVGHSDLGANRKRIERLREALS